MEHLCPRDHGRPARGTPSRRLPPDAGVAQATRRSPWRALCSASANSSIIFLLNALMSSGLRLVIIPMSLTTSSSTHFPPAFPISVRSEGHDVRVRSLTASASTSIHGPWHIEATGLPASKQYLPDSTASAVMRYLSGFHSAPAKST